MMQQSLRASPAVKKRAKSVYQQRNLGTIKKRKKEKQEEKEVNNGETILRILRMRCVSIFLPTRISMGRPVIWKDDTDRTGRCSCSHRPNTSDFIAQQREAMINLQAQRDAQAKAKEKRGGKPHRPRQQPHDEIPPIPEVPPLPPK